MTRLDRSKSRASSGQSVVLAVWIPFGKPGANNMLRIAQVMEQ